MSAPLPYDATPPPSPPQPAPAQLDAAEPSALDRALDEYDYTPEVPEHVKSLMGRMSKGKVYLMEESPGILHLDSEEKLRRDPRIAALAHRLDNQDPTEWLGECTSTRSEQCEADQSIEAISAGAPSPIRAQALYLRSDLIQHLSTAKMFSWASSLGASVMGIEWLNDTTLHLLFPTPAAALLGLTLLSKAGFDPAEGDDPLLERAAHSVPYSLLPLAEPEPVDSLEGKELLSDSLPPAEDGVKRKGRGKFGTTSTGIYDLEPLVPAAQDGLFKLAPGVDPHARLAIRYALEGDKDLRKEAKQSEWYKRHGRNAGKEVATSKRFTAGGRYGEDAPTFSGRGSGEGRDFAKRIGRERREPYARPTGAAGQRDRGRRTQDDLDRELENMARRRTGDETMDVDAEVEEYRPRREGRRERQPRGNKVDLDKELDDLFAARSAAV